MNLQKNIDQLKEFHNAFNVTTNNGSNASWSLRYTMLNSEYEELEEEISEDLLHLKQNQLNANMFTENAFKEICDIRYIAIGTLQLFFMDDYNKLSDGNYLHERKCAEYSKNMYEMFIKHHVFAFKNEKNIIGIDKDNVGSQTIGDILYTLRLFIGMSVRCRKLHEMIQCLGFIITNTEYLIHTMLGGDTEKAERLFNELFDKVHASNMSKLDDNGKPIINDGIINPNEPIGKVLKSSNYRKANILPILQKHGIHE